MCDSGDWTMMLWSAQLIGTSADTDRRFDNYILNERQSSNFNQIPQTDHRLPKKWSLTSLITTIYYDSVDVVINCVQILWHFTVERLFFFHATQPTVSTYSGGGTIHIPETLSCCLKMDSWTKVTKKVFHFSTGIL